MSGKSEIPDNDGDLEKILPPTRYYPPAETCHAGFKILFMYVSKYVKYLICGPWPTNPSCYVTFHVCEYVNLLDL